MTLFGNKIFADVIKVRVKMRSYWNGMGPESNQGVPVRDKLYVIEKKILKLTYEKGEWLAHVIEIPG